MLRSLINGRSHPIQCLKPFVKGFWLLWKVQMNGAASSMKVYMKGDYLTKTPHRVGTGWVMVVLDSSLNEGLHGARLEEAVSLQLAVQLRVKLETVCV